jgi:hypothetical protein
VRLSGDKSFLIFVKCRVRLAQYICTNPSCMDKLFAVLGAIFVLFTSCSEPRALLIHTPDKVNAPGLEKKHDLKLDVSIKPQATEQGGSPVSATADAAFAITDNLGVIASYRGVNGRSAVYERHTYDLWGGFVTSETQKFMLYGGRFDAGIGAFHAWKHIKLEAYAGAGLGSIRNESYSSNPGFYKVSYNNFFGQFAFGFYNSRLSFSIGCRVAGIQYNTFYYNAGGYIGIDPGVYDFRDRGALYVTPF